MSLPDPTVTGVPETGPLISPVFGTGDDPCWRYVSCRSPMPPTRPRSSPSTESTSRCGAGSSAVVGESGCGKSTLLYAIAQLLNPPAGVIGGSVKFHGSEMVDMTDRRLRHIRWRELSVVMQSAMNTQPRHDGGRADARPRRAHSDMSDEAIAELREMFDWCPSILRTSTATPISCPGACAAGHDRHGPVVHAAAGGHGRADFGTRRCRGALADAPDQRVQQQLGFAVISSPMTCRSISSPTGSW